MGIKKASSREENKVKFPFPDGYFCITSIRQENGKFNIQVRGYADQTASKSRSSDNQGPMMPGGGSDPMIFEKGYSFSEAALPVPKLKTAAKDTLKHCSYLWLKQNDFSSGEDVLEEGQA